MIHDRSESYAVLSFLLLTGPVLGQGADDCSMADPIGGPGIFAFDNSAATTDGSPDPLCSWFGSDDIENDVWFAWSASSTSSVTVTTCGGTAIDTKIAALEGGCGGIVVACNDDTPQCGTTSTIGFQAVAGQTYHLRIGTWPSSPGGTGTFEIIESTPVLNPTTGNHYLAVTAPWISWEESRDAAWSMTHLGAPGHLVVITDDAEDTWIWNNLTSQDYVDDLGKRWLGGYQDTSAPDYSEPDGGWRWINGEPWVFTDWGANNPSNSANSEDYLLLVSATLEPSGKWNDAGNWLSTRGYIVEFEGGLGTSYCGPAVPNSTGAPGVMSAAGSALVSLNNVTLSASDLPQNSFGFFLTSQAQGLVMNPGGSQGNLCLGGAIGRYVGPGQIQNTGGAGEFSLVLDLQQTPTPTGFVSVAGGETWNFQAWHRDAVGGSATSNFTDGLQIDFQ